jgi:tRNA-specific 2-thiouridylase
MADRALIAMSGGVDSSVAAYLVKERGFSCIGATMKLFANADIGESRERSCCSLNDVEDARQVANRLDIPYYVLNLAGDFKRQVIERFIKAYEKGGTPNPCVDCNRYIKFGLLLGRARELSCDFLATGHYARIEKDAASGRLLLKKAVDPKKDQSYFLYAMTQEQLLHTMFPLGGLSKEETRSIAAAQGFVNAKKHESQDICFVPGGDYAAFIEQYTGKDYACGNFIDKAGNILGRHKGFIRYTIGQRRGIGIAFPQAMYVAGKCPADNTVTLAAADELYSGSLMAEGVNWIACAVLRQPLRVKVKIRYRQPEEWAVVEQTADSQARVAFERPQRAIANGQAVVFYDGDTVVGGGTIMPTTKGYPWV